MSERAVFPFPDGSEGVAFGLSPRALDRLRKAVGDIQSVIRESVPRDLAPPDRPLPKDLDVIGLALRIGGIPNTLFARPGDLTRPGALALRTLETDKTLARDAMDRNLPVETVIECERMYRRSREQHSGQPRARCSIEELTAQAFQTFHEVYSGQYFEQVERFLAQEAAASRQRQAEARRSASDGPEDPPAPDPAVVH